MKVQGRFFDIPYSVAIDEVVFLLAEAIKGRKINTAEKKLCREVGTELKDARLGSSKNLSQQLSSIFPYILYVEYYLGLLQGNALDKMKKKSLWFSDL